MAGSLDWKNFHVRSRANDFRSLRAVAPLDLHRRRAAWIWYLLFASLVSLAALPWMQTATGRGRVVAFAPDLRQQVISAPVSGRIERWHVVEGARVSAGDPVVDLRDNDPEILKRLRSERDALLRRERAARLGRETAQLHVARQRQLLSEGLASQRGLEQAQLEVARYDADWASAQAELTRLEVRLARQESQSVKAPVDGTILRVLSAQAGGQLVKEGDPVAVIVPATESRAAELLIDGNDVPLVREGQEVRLRFEGWPAIQFSGWPSVAVGTFRGRVSLVDAADDGRGKFRILVVPESGAPWPSARHLRQGIRAEGWVLVNEVPLGFELWRRLNGFPTASSEIPGVLDAK